MWKPNCQKIHWYPQPTSDELYHHGILGQKWGKKNGPPYPLDASNHSAAEKKAGWKKSLNDRTSKKKVKKAPVILPGYKEDGGKYKQYLSPGDYMYNREKEANLEKRKQQKNIDNSYMDDSPKNRNKRCKNMVSETNSVNASVPRTVNDRKWEKAVWDTNTFQDFLKRPSVQKVYETRNKGYDNADGDDVYKVGDDFNTAIKTEIKKYVGEHTGTKAPVILPGYKEDGGKYKQYLSPGDYMYKMVELADWGDTNENVHKYAHDRAWLYWH